MSLEIEWEAREAWNKNNCFPKVDDNFIAELATYGPFIEVGAGTGYMAKRLHDKGAVIQATDLYPPTSGQNPYRWKHEHYPVKRMNAAKAVRNYPSRTVLMSWPSYGKKWALMALHAMAPGQRLVYIGEGRHGCTANDGFFTYLSTNFSETHEILLDNFYGIHDECHIYTKNTSV